MDTGRVTPGTRAPGETAKLVDGPVPPTWGAREGPQEVLAVLCYLVCPSSLRVMSLFRKKATASSGTIPVSRNPPSRCV